MVEGVIRAAKAIVNALTPPHDLARVADLSYLHRLSDRPIPGPHRRPPGTMDDALEPALNAFAITFADRFPAAETY